MYTLHLSGERPIEDVLQEFEAHVHANRLSQELREKVERVARNFDQSGRNILASKSTMSAKQVVDVDGTRIRIVASYGTKPRPSVWAMLRGIFAGQR